MLPSSGLGTDKSKCKCKCKVPSYHIQTGSFFFFYSPLPRLVFTSLARLFSPLPLQFHYRGLKRWRTPNNQARTEWNVNSVPTILRLENVSLLNSSLYLPFSLSLLSTPLPSVYLLPCRILLLMKEEQWTRTSLMMITFSWYQGKETGRLVEDEILDKARLQAFIK